MKIALRHGSGGEETTKLIQDIFAAHFHNDILNKMEDAAVLPEMKGSPVFTSDSFVVQPLFFPGGDIGRLAVCGTVNGGPGSGPGADRRRPGPGLRGRDEGEHLPLPR